MVRRTLAALAMMLLTGGCLTSRIGPGVLRQDWNQRPRDPDPMRNPAAQEPDNRWTTNTPPRIPGPGEAQAPASGETEDVAGDEDSPAVDLARRWAATFLAWSLAGWLPLVEISGTFEEDPTTRKLHEQRRRRAERAQAEHRKRRIERAGPDDR